MTEIQWRLLGKKGLFRPFVQVLSQNYWKMPFLFAVNKNPKINFWLINRLIAQIPQCTKPIYHNAPFWNRNMLENGASWFICLMHCGICEMDELFIILLKWFLKMTTSRRIVSHIGFKKWFRLIQLDQTTVINKHLCADSVWISTMFFIVKIALRYYHYRALKDMFQSLCKSKKEVSLGLIQTGAIKPRILLNCHTFCHNHLWNQLG